jgi:Ras-related protein Rab-7A
VNSFPFALLGNKIDREHERKVDSREAKEWCTANNDMIFYETSAKEGVSVEQAFHEIAKRAMKRAENNNIVIPESIGGASGAIKLNANNSKDQRGASQTKSSCCS